MSRLLASSLLVVFTCAPVTARAGADTLRIVTYALDSLADRTVVQMRDTLRTVVAALDADVLLLQGLGGAGIDPVAEVVRNANPRLQSYSVGGNLGHWQALFFDEALVHLRSSTPIGAPSDIMTEWELDLGRTGDTLFVFGLQFPHGSDTVSVQGRHDAVVRLFQRTTRFRVGRLAVALGDMAFLSASEYSYVALVHRADSPPDISHFTDVAGAAGTWHNNPAFAPLHTSSTRVATGGVYNGLVDRYDFILASVRLDTTVGARWLPETYTVFGNDGRHFGRAVNDDTNLAVSKSMADALYSLSSHLPVALTLVFPDTLSGIPFEAANPARAMARAAIVAPNPSDVEPLCVIVHSMPANVAAHLALYDSFGRIVSARQITLRGDEEERIVFEDTQLAAGVYRVVVESEGMRQSAQFVVVR